MVMEGWALQLEKSPPFANADWATFLADRGIGGGGGAINLSSYVKKTELEAELLKYYTKIEVDDLLFLLGQALRDEFTLALNGAVQVANKASVGDVVAGVLDRWVDAATLNGYTFSRGEIAAEDQKLQDQITDLTVNLFSLYAQTKDVVLRSMKATPADLTAGTVDRWVDARELKNALDLIASTAPVVASADQLGVVRVGGGLSIDADGILSADVQDVPAGLLVLLDEAGSNAVIVNPAAARIGDVVVFPGSMELPAGWANAAGKAVQAGDLATLRPNGTWQLMAGESAQEIIDLAFQNTQTLIQAYVNQLVAKADQATGEDVEGGVAGKWIDAATFREKLTQALQYVEDKFSITRPDGSVAQPGYVYTLRQVAGPPGSGQFTEYGWEPVPAGGGDVPLATSDAPGIVRPGIHLRMIPNGMLNAPSGMMVYRGPLASPAVDPPVKSLPIGEQEGSVYSLTAGGVCGAAWDNFAGVTLEAGELVVYLAPGWWARLTTAASGTLPVATATALGGIKVGANLTVAADGTLTVPLASTSVTGIVRIANGGGLRLSNGSLDTLEGTLIYKGKITAQAAPAGTGSMNVGSYYIFSTSGTLTGTAWGVAEGKYVNVGDTLLILGLISVNSVLKVDAQVLRTSEVSGEMVYRGMTTIAAAPSGANSLSVGSTYIFSNAGILASSSWQNLVNSSVRGGDLLIVKGTTSADRFQVINSAPVTGLQTVDLSAYAKLADPDQSILLKELSGYQVSANIVKATELQLSVSTGIGISTEAPGTATETNRVVLYRTDTVDGQPIEPLAFVSDLAVYAKLRDLAQILEARIVYADDLCTDLLKFGGKSGDLESYRWAVGVRPSFVTGTDALMLGSDGFPEGVEILNRADGIDLLRLVQSWFVGANLPEPALPSHSLRSVATVLRREVPPGNRMAPEAIDEALQRSVGSLVGRQLEPGQLALLRGLVADPGWDGSDASLEAAMADLDRALNGGAEVVDPFVRRSELPTTGPTPGVVEAGVQLRLRGAGGPVAVPAQQWTRLQALTPMFVSGSWDAENGAVTIPETGQYEVFVQALTTVATDGPSTELLVRVVGADGVYSGDSGTTTALGALLEHSAVIAAEAGDQVAVEVYAEGSGVSLHRQTLVLRLALVGGAASREVWQSPPPPWGLAAEALPVVEAPRQIVLTVGAQALASSLTRLRVAAEGTGGAVAVPGSSGGAAGIPVSVGSQIGRLFKVSGRINGASRAVLALTGNGPDNNVTVGTSRGAAVVNDPMLPAYIHQVEASASATRVDFSRPLLGSIYGPDMLYVAQGGANLELRAMGGQSSGGSVTLLDVTPAEWGDTPCAILRADKTITMAAPNSSGWLGMPLTDLWSSDNPALCPVSSGDGVGSAFRLNGLPSGIYRISGSFTVTGEHNRAGWCPGWTCSTLVKDWFLPSQRVRNADGSVTYEIDTIYRCGTVDTTMVGMWFRVDPLANNAGKPLGVKGELRFQRLPQGATTSKVVLPLRPNQALKTSSMYLEFDGSQERTGWGLMMMNAHGGNAGFDPYLTTVASWSSYVPNAPSLGPAWASTHGLFMQVPAANVSWNAKLSLLVEGGLSAAELRQRRVGANNATTAIVNRGRQADGNTLYELSLSNVAVIDGLWFENFLCMLATGTTGARLVSGDLTLEGTVNQQPLP